MSRFEQAPLAEESKSRFEQAPETSTLEKLGGDPESPLSGLIGVGETALSAATGTVGAFRGAVRGGLRAAVPGFREGKGPGEAFVDEFEETTGRLTYQPRTQAGKTISEALAWPFQKAEELGERMGETTVDRAMAKGRSEEGAAARGAFVKTAVSGVPYVALAMLGRLGKKNPSPSEKAGVTKELDVAPEEVVAKTRTELAKQVAGKLDADTVVRDELRTLSQDTLDKVQTFLQTDLSKVEIPRAGTDPKLNYVNYLITTEDAKKALIATQAITGTRGKRTLAQVKQDALNEGKTVRDLLGPQGEEISSANVMMFKSVLAAAGKNLESLRKRAATGTEAEKALFAAQFEETMKLVDQFDGVKSEWGRTGRVLREPISDEIARATSIKKLNEKTYFGHSVNDIISMTENMSTPELIEFANKARKATNSEKFLEAWKAGLLTGLRTHEANMASNFIAQTFSLQEHLVASGLGKILPRSTPGDKVFFRELPAQVTGMANGAVDGAKLAAEILRRGETSAEAAKALDVTSRYQAIPGKVGTVVRTPYRVLAAEDALFKEMAKQTQMHTLAVREAAGKTKTAKEFQAAYQELLQNPTEQMLKQADDFALYMTFNKDLGRTGKAIQSAIASHPAFSVIVPFVRTPTNVIKFAGERTPLAAFSQNVRAELAKGGAARDLAISKMIVGSSWAGFAFYLASQDVLTGNGPVPPGERSVWLNTKKPYSIKIGETYYPYNRFEPVGTLFGAAADIREVWNAAGTEEKDRLAAMLSAAISKNITNKTMVAGISSAILAQTDASRYGERFVNQLAGSVMPTIAAEVTQSRDPIYRQIDSMTDAIKARTPGLSETLYPKRDLYGREIKRHGGGISAFAVSPGQDIQSDPAYTELARLRMSMSAPERKVLGKELDASVYDRYSRDAGELAYNLVSKIVQHPSYAKAPPMLQQDMIERSFKESRKMARLYHGIEEQRTQIKLEQMKEGLK